MDNNTRYPLGRGWSSLAFRLELAIGFKLVWGFTSYGVVLSPRGYLARLIGHRRKRELLSSWRILMRATPKFVTTASVDVTQTIPESWESLWERVVSRYRFIVQRDRSYLGWRFLKHPTHTYHFVQVRKSNVLRGVAIVRITDDEEPFGIISDLIVDPEDWDSLNILLMESLAFLKSKGACGALVDLPEKLATSVGKVNAFRRTFGIIVYAPEQAMSEAGIFDASNWYQGRSDSDTDF